MNNLILLCGVLGILISASSAPLAVEVELLFDGRPLRLDALNYRTGSGETLSFSRISMLLSGFALQTGEGRWMELEDVYAYVDASSRRLTASLGNIPEGNYRALRFSIGPPPRANHSDPVQYAADHPLNPVLNHLHWDWQSGYIFCAIEGRFQTLEKAVSGYVLHFANDENRTRINLPLNLDGTDSTLIRINLDLAALFNMPGPISLSDDGHITHSRENDTLAGKIKHNLPTAFSLGRIRVKKTLDEQPVPLSPLYLPEQYEPYPLKLSSSFSIPDLPEDNPLIRERVELGEKLFNDNLLSADRTLSCASCHKTEHALTDALPVSRGVADADGRRNAMPLFNLAWKQEFFWDGRAPSLREQVIQPITNPLEMANDVETVLQRLKIHPEYPALFAAAFHPAEPSAEKIGLALEAYLLTLVSSHSKLDEARKGKAELTTEEQRGMELFFTEYDPRTRQYGADCFHCHGGAAFTDHQFHNNGLKQGTDFGRFDVTGKNSDRFKFSTPSLRNVELTAPYMHDGRFQTLEEVMDHYTSPMETSDTLDPNLAKHPQTGLQLAESDKTALVAFLKTLTDPQYK